MSGYISSMEFQSINNEYTAAQRRKLVAQNMIANSSTSSQSVFQSSGTENDYYGYECVDGADDGQISFWEKAKCAVNGVGKSLLNMVTGAIKNPVQTIGMVALCCVPVVGPLAMGFFAAKGLVSGIGQVVQAASIASNATSDAEAMYAWENIGSGSFQAGASVVGLKGAGSLLKSQLSGGSMTVNTIRSGETVGQIVKTAINETGKNMGAVAKAAVNKVSNIGRSIKNAYEGIKSNGFSTYLSEKFTQFQSWGRTKVNQFADNVQQKIDNFGKDSNGTSLAERVRSRFSKAGKAQRKAEADAAAENLEGLKSNPNAKKTSSGYEVTEKGSNGAETTKVYDSNGYLKETTVKTTQNGVTTTEITSYNKNGTTRNIKTTEAPAKGTTGKTVETNEKFGSLGSHKTTTTATTKNADGSTITSVETDKTTVFGNHISKGKQTVTNAGGKSVQASSYRINEGTGVVSFKQTSGDITESGRSGNGYASLSSSTKVGGKTKTTNGYSLNDYDTTTLTPTERLRMYANTTDVGVYANRFVGKARTFDNNPFYSLYSWYEATKDENQ